MEQRSIGELNRIDLVDFLDTIGIRPKKKNTYHYYYCSPLAGHPANRPTFIVDRRLNQWRETTTKQSGSLIDLAVGLYDCTIGELTDILCAAVQRSASPQHPDNATPITVTQTHPIRSGYLERHLWEHRISLNVARLYLCEAWYCRENSLRQALAFHTDAGGYELFTPGRHYSVPPCAPTHICNHSKTVAVFRHVFDLLTYATLFQAPISKLPDLLVLNAPAPFQVIQPIIAAYQNKYLFLPNDAAGIAFSILATQAFQNCQDRRLLYAGYPTLNDWICRIGTAQGPRNPLSRHDAPE